MKGVCVYTTWPSPILDPSNVPQMPVSGLTRECTWTLRQEVDAPSIFLIILIVLSTGGLVFRKPRMLEPKSSSDHAAAQAQTLADHETNQIRNLTNSIIKSSLKNIALKMEHSGARRYPRDGARRNLGVARQAVFSERAGIKKALDGVLELMAGCSSRKRWPLG